MDVSEAVEKLRAAGAVPDDTLARLSAASGDAIEDTLVEVFDFLDAQPRTPSAVTGMGVVADALETSRGNERLDEMASRLRARRHAATSRRAPLGSFGGRPRKPVGTNVVAITPRVTGAKAQDIVNRDALVLEMTERLNDATRQPGRQLLVASARWEDQYPDDRRLTNDPLANESLMRAVTEPQAITAAGGLCGPIDVDFTVLAFATDDRPLADGLPSFGAAHGGLRFMLSPTFAAVGSSATTIWTHEQDAATPYPNADGTLPNGTTVKPIQTITCPEEDEVLVDAIPTRLRLGEFVGRFSPEWVQGFTTNVMANAARTAETYLLERISAFSTSVSSGQLLGATRDLLATMDQVVAAFRWRNRLPDSQPLSVAFPRWVINLLRADLTRELAHGDDSNLDLTDAEVTSLIRSRGVDPIFTLDSDEPSQNFGMQQEGALLDWPHTLRWFLWATGTVVRLDGGRLDLSVIRDITGAATNTYETFVESFENVLYRGGTEVLEIASAVRPNGASAGTISTATY